MLYGAFHSILACLNPRPVVEITPGHIVHGSSVAMRWRLGGRVDRIQSLRIDLNGLKITTETRRSGGESETSVVRTPFYNRQLLVSSNTAEIGQGTLQFVIPADQPASRRSNHNGIEWQIRFHAAIPRWPDIQTELVFLVYPPEGG